MKKVMIVLGMIAVLANMIGGCRKSEGEKSRTVKSKKEYIGKYIYEKQFGTALRTETLEIKNDGTYKLIVETGGAFDALLHISIGRWKIDEDRVLLSDNDGLPRIIGELKGNTLINRLPGGEIYTKQN